MMKLATMNPKSRTKSMRVVVANEPLSYREVISGTLGKLRTDAEVIVVGPEALDAAVLRLLPQLVICNRVSAVIEEHVLVWAELYPDGSTASEVSILHKRSRMEEVRLEDLFSLLDRAASLA